MELVVCSAWYMQTTIFTTFRLSRAFGEREILNQISLISKQNPNIHLLSCGKSRRRDIVGFTQDLFSDLNPAYKLVLEN
jgi:hypothetical protein